MDKIWRKGQTGIRLEREDGRKPKEGKKSTFKKKNKIRMIKMAIKLK